MMTMMAMMAMMRTSPCLARPMEGWTLSVSPKQLPANDIDGRDNHRNHDNVEHYDDHDDLGQVVILSDPFNCNTLAVKAAHHPHCPTERQGQRKHAKDNDKTLPGGVSDHHDVGDSKSSQARAELVAQKNCQHCHLLTVAIQKPTWRE